MEARRPAPAHCPPAARFGFQRSAGAPRASHPGRRAMSDADRPIDPKNLVALAIEAAEDLLDPLEGLVENTASDPGAPFAPDALERLAALKKDDRAAFEALRAQLKG